MFCSHQTLTKNILSEHIVVNYNKQIAKYHQWNNSIFVIEQKKSDKPFNKLFTIINGAYCWFLLYFYILKNLYLLFTIVEYEFLIRKQNSKTCNCNFWYLNKISSFLFFINEDIKGQDYDSKFDIFCIIFELINQWNLITLKSTLLLHN